MLELEDVLAIDLVEVDLHTEDLVVTHAHQVPGRVIGLAVVRLVPRAAPDLLASDHVRHGEVKGPPDPAPVHVIVGRALDLVDLAHLPVLSAVGGDFDTGDTTSASSVGITSNLVSASNVSREVDGLIVIGRGHGRVDVEFVEDVLRLVPPSSSQTLLRSDVGRQDAVVVVMVVVLRLVLQDVDVSEPLNHTATNVSGNDEAHGETVIGLKLLSIGLVRNENIVGGVHGARQRNGRSILHKLAPWLVLERSGSNLVRKILMSNEFNMLAGHVALLDAGSEEKITKEHSLPNIGRDTSGAPVESNGLTNHVLLLTAISGAHESYGKLTSGHVDNVVHAEVQLARDHAANAHAVLLPLDVRTGAVVAHVVKAGGGDELEFLVDVQRRLDVEGVTAREAHELSVAGDPFVGSSNVAVIGVRLEIPHVLGLGDDEGAGRAAILVRHGNGYGGGVGPISLLASGFFFVIVLVVFRLEVGGRRRRFDEGGEVNRGLRDFRANENHGY
mmetsp:Transcript_37678/g.64262  ORF Transcript_37678/g.64262 Transcript_37678/m.64262 type:complete len:501 (+) Transcript_37678:1389-2891(+)